MKAIEVMHTSFGVYAAVTVIAVVIVIGLIATSPGVTRHLPRLGKCAAFGAAAAIALDVYVDTKRHAQLAAEAAKPVNGHHVTTGYLLACGFAGAFLIVTTVTFAIATVVARRRARSIRRASASWQLPSRPPSRARSWPS